MKTFENRVAVITGAASGIGRATAERCARAGMRVVLADVEETALAAAERALRERGATVLAVRTDVAKADEVEALARRTVEAFGGVHVLCNNAGVVAGGLAWELSLADWQWVMDVNLWGVIHGVRAFVPRMIAQGTEAHVVNTASMAGLVASPMNAVYNVTKFGVVALSESLHHELALVAPQVKVSVLCPGWVNTNILDAERNRPAARPATPPARQQTESERNMEAVARHFLSTGLDPAAVAELVFAAIRDERFYILTHPWKNMIRNRMEDILEERTPTLTTFV